MKHFLAGLLAVAAVIGFALSGSVWLATGIPASDPFAVIAGTAMLFASSAGIYVIGEALDT